MSQPFTMAFISRNREKSLVIFDCCWMKLLWRATLDVNELRRKCFLPLNERSDWSLHCSSSIWGSLHPASRLSTPGTFATSRPTTTVALTKRADGGRHDWLLKFAALPTTLRQNAAVPWRQTTPDNTDWSPKISGCRSESTFLKKFGILRSADSRKTNPPPTSMEKVRLLMIARWRHPRANCFNPI